MRTQLSIRGSHFLINGSPSYAGRMYQGTSLEGLLLNARLVQALFDDLNPASQSRWTLPDGRAYDAERNVAEFLEMLPIWKRHGLLGVAFNLQGGSPEGYSQDQPWINSTFAPDGSLRSDYLGRLERVLTRLDDLGMVAILGFFYFGQSDAFESEAAVLGAVDAITDWLLAQGWQNLVIEIANECDTVYELHQPIIDQQRVPELIRRVQARSSYRWPVGTSFMGGVVPTPEVMEGSDCILIHGNDQSPDQMRDLVRKVREHSAYRGQPIVCNEDDHYDFDQPDNNFLATLREGAGWGYFDYRRKGEPFEAGYQSMPCSWQIDHPRKQGFFHLLKQITGGL